ncbi:MAG: carbon-nitrogen hydrolase [Nitrospiraceae bacterium]|nr:carbon-nitrogen hydrolase [Nitrospiraceae bacterium]|tara:strand:+ start:6301 stop:7098 length:798 start_codon:yes stop_codon:yes gene_type:complete
MKVAYVQFSPALRDLHETISRLEALFPACGEADLVVLPELCNSGYSFCSKKEAFDSSEQIENSQFLSFLGARCREYSLDIVTGFNERSGNTLYNSAVLIGPEGYVGSYRKMHLFMNEKDYFCPGDNGLPVFQRQNAVIGLLVCYDWFFAEVWKILALKGADIICHPSNLILPGLAQQGIPFHAVTNRVFIVTANRIGTEGSLTFTGNSLIVDARGEVLSHAPAAKAHVDVVSIDLERARDKAVTFRNHLFEDRRPQDYEELLSMP